VWSDTRPATTTAGDLLSRAHLLAGGLRRRGIGPGDVVAYQLPNWLDTLEILWAGFHVGATMVPIIHFYGPREVEFILRQSGAKALVTCSSFGAVDHLDNLASIRAGLDGLETVVVVDGGGRTASVPGGIDLADLADGDPLTEPATVDPDAVAMIGYTSGTTADPKGVMHSHRSLLAEVRQLAANINLREPTIMASPLAHMTGMLGGSLVPLQNGAPLELIDRFDPGRILGIMAEHGIGLGGGATIFLTSLLDHPDFGPHHVEVMPRMGLGGAPVPAAVADRAEALGIKITRAYGSTEHPSITGCRIDHPVHSRTRTDGVPLPGVDIRLVDDDGNQVTTGTPGEILSRGPDLFVGYTDPALTDKVMEGSWYRTGDVGVLDDDGCLTITDRVSDLIIRGGLNISAAELEERIATLPTVAEVAVVAAPDERLGERACAVLRVVPGADAPDLAALQAHLESAGLPRQKWPEDLRVVDDFARTPSGKIKKRDLRAWLREDPTA
ncbi:MAG: AMP-binding protein, partial [Actinomycetota bacterium]|nr:AMP-binding protein [Actinomycetota bacterium]